MRRQHGEIGVERYCHTLWQLLPNTLAVTEHPLQLQPRASSTRRLLPLSSGAVCGTEEGGKVYIGETWLQEGARGRGREQGREGGRECCGEAEQLQGQRAAPVGKSGSGEPATRVSGPRTLSVGWIQGTRLITQPATRLITQPATNSTQPATNRVVWITDTHPVLNMPLLSVPAAAPACFLAGPPHLT
eukprot:1550689-Rhodomonas_salina.1